MYLRTKICENQKKCLFLHRFSTQGPFVYRLGRKIFILERGVRFSYGLQLAKLPTAILLPGVFYGGLASQNPASATAA